MKFGMAKGSHADGTFTHRINKPMKLSGILIGLILLPLSVWAQQEEIEHIFNDQVDAFNQGDIDRLVNNVAEDFKWFYLSSDTLILEIEGRENFKTSMEAYFASGIKVQSQIEEYVIDGKRISFKEVVRYKNKEGKTIASSAMGIYEIHDDKIYRAWYFLD